MLRGPPAGAISLNSLLGWVNVPFQIAPAKLRALLTPALESASGADFEPLRSSAGRRLRSFSTTLRGCDVSMCYLLFRSKGFRNITFTQVGVPRHRRTPPIATWKGGAHRGDARKAKSVGSEGYTL